MTLVTELVDQLVPDCNAPDADWRRQCRFCVQHYPWLSRRELTFVVQLARYKAPPSRKQLTILQNLAARCRNEAA